MINFIDINTGKIFEGSKPYVFYFDERQSTGINYVKKILFISDVQYVKSIIANNSIFSIIDIKQASNDSYSDLTKMKTNELLSSGYLYNGYYIHAIYILCQSGEEGTFIDDIRFQTQTGKELLTISVGAIFQGENEALKINLSNFGFEIPDQFQKAIYETNIHEDVSDNILINRKYKELLNENINILANKGSYKSLLNSLNWFEYGDLIKIQEYWKHNELDKTVLSGTELNTFVSDKLKNLLLWSSKTTYIGIYYALNNIRYINDKLVYNNDYNKLISAENVNGVVLLPAELNTLLANSNKNFDRILQIGENGVTIQDYENPGTSPYLDSNYMASKGSNFELIKAEDKMYLLDEPIPELFDVVDKWSKEDMMLKMALLGNFYATYFMPIHLDLIHSTVENIIYTNTIKVINFNKLDRNDYIDILDSVICTNVNNDDVFYIKETGQLEVYSITPGNTYDLIDSWEKASEIILGVDLSSRDYLMNSEEYLKKYLSQYYNGLGSVVKFNFLIKNAEKDTFIKSIQICIEKDGDKLKIYNTYTNIPVNDTTFDFNINLLFKESGNYHIGFNFMCSNSKNYITTKNISIYDNTNQYITIKKVVKRNLDVSQKSILNYDILKDLLSFSPAFSVLKDVLGENDDVKDRIYNNHFHIGSNIGENHFVLLNKNEFDGSVALYSTNSDSYLVLNNDITIDKLSNKFSHYYWDMIDNTDKGEEKIKTYIIGINKYFHIDNDETINYYHKEGKVYINGKSYDYRFDYNVTNNKVIFDFNCDYNNYNYISEIAIDLGDYTQDIPSVINDLDIQNLEYNIKYRVTFDNNIVLNIDFCTKLHNNQLFYGSNLNSVKFKKLGEGKINKDTYYSSYRFFRFFHDVIDVEDNYIFNNTDTLCFEIEIPYSKNFSTVGWEIVNITTNEVVRPTSKTGKVINQKTSESKNLKKGYYNIVFNYKLGEEVLRKELESAFLIK